jgi:serine/threonine-protein kinase
MALLGILTWALGGSTPKQDTPEAGGARRVETPAVVGLSLDEARRRLEGAGLKLGSQKEASSDEVAEGAVIQQIPAAGTEVKRGSDVNVTLSTGPAQEPAKQSSPSASATASPSASATASPSASPANAEEAEKAAEEAAKKRQEERAKAVEEARRAAEERQEERAKALEEKQKEAEK